MKKILAFTFALLMLVSFTACSDSSPSSLIKRVEHGKINGTTYTNKAANITFTSPENWTFASDSELLSISETNNHDKLTSEVQIEILNKSGIAFDMMCISSDDEACSVGIMFVNTDFEEIKDFTFEDILYNMTGGLDVTTTDTSTVTLGDEEYTKYSISSMSQESGKPIYAAFYGRQEGNIIYIIVASYTDAITDKEIENCFG